MFGRPEIIGFGGGDFCVREIDRKLANEMIRKNHYSGKFFSLSYIHLGVIMRGKIVGCIQIGYAMNPASGGSIVPDTKNDEFCELNRMWLSDDAPRNSESMAISFAIKYIRAKYPKIKFMQSFADERCGRLGIVYQAANFQYYGRHDSEFWELDGVFYHNIIMTNGQSNAANARYLRENRERATKHVFGQYRYIFWIQKKFRSRCALPEFEYQKHYAGTSDE